MAVLPVLTSSGVLLRVKDEVSVSSGIVANFLRTCFSAGRRIGLLSSWINTQLWSGGISRTLP